MGHPAKVSVIMPTFNRAATIQRAIDSVLSQTYRDFELIVVDDGSTDGTADIVRANRDERIFLVVSESNRGAAAARNLGVSQSTGEVICFLDSDDVWLCTFLARSVEKLQQTPEAVFVYALLVNGPRWTLEGAGKFREALTQGFVSITITMAVRRSAFLSVGGFDESLKMCQDDDLCFKLVRTGAFALIPEALAVSIFSEDSISRGREKVALGWERLYGVYRKDYLAHCGDGIYALKMFELAQLFFLAGHPFIGLKYGRIALRHALKEPGAFRIGEVLRIPLRLVKAWLSGLP